MKAWQFGVTVLLVGAVVMGGLAGCGKATPAPTPAPVATPIPAPVATPVPVAAPTPTPAAPPKVFKWKMTDMGLTTVAQWRWSAPDGLFVKWVAERSGGRLMIENTPKLVKDDDILYAVSDGRVQFGVGSPNYINADKPLWDPGSLPLIVSSVHEFMQVMKDPNVKEILDRAYLKENIVRLGLSTTSLQYPFSSRPIKTVDDFKGLKLRGMGALQVDTLKALGASPIGMLFGEALAALPRGTIDGLLTGSYAGVAFGVFKTAPILNLWPLTPAFFAEWVVNKKAWDELPEDLQKVLRGVAEDVEFANWGAAEVEDFFAQLALKAAGGTVIVPDKSEIEKAKKLTQGTIAGWVARTGPEGKALLDAIEQAKARIK